MRIFNLLIGLLWLISLIWLHTLHRADFYPLWGMYSISFGAYIWLTLGKQTITLKHGLLLAIVARFISLLFEPQLSDDYFRFIWDGMVMGQGVHPMAYTPSFLIAHPEIIQAPENLYALLNSKNYYSVYPPVAQWIFALSYKMNGMNIAGHIIFYKALLISVDLIIIFLLYKLLQAKNILTHRILVFALNPLLIVEFTGNLHMDGIMIAGLLGAVLLARKKDTLWSSLLMALSILSKMLTLVLIPFMPKEMYWRRISLFTILTILWSVSIFWLSFGRHTGWLESVRLWFFTFEFNASLYYIVRWLGYLIVGYNNIEKIGPALAGLTLLGIGILWWNYMRRSNFEWSSFMLYVLTLYFLMSTTIHPWYLGLMLALSVISLHVYPIVWTYLVFLSYSHYQGGLFGENYLLISIEYMLLLGWMVWEWRSRNVKGIPRDIYSMR